MSNYQAAFNIVKNRIDVFTSNFNMEKDKEFYDALDTIQKLIDNHCASPECEQTLDWENEKTHKLLNIFCDNEYERSEMKKWIADKGLNFVYEFVNNNFELYKESDYVSD